MTNKLSSLRIERFRQIRHLEVSSLGDVNLIVGGNNSGKTTLLEALRVFAAKGSPALIQELLESRGELAVRGSEAFNDPEIDRTVANLFFGRSFPDSDETEIFIGEVDRSVGVSIEHVLLRRVEEIKDVDGGSEIVRRLRKIPKTEADFSGEEGLEALEIKSFDGRDGLALNLKFSQKVNLVPLSEIHVYPKRYSRIRLEENFLGLPVSYVSSRATAKDSLAEAWDDLVLTDGEDVVLESLRLIEPRTQGLAFVQGGRAVGSSAARNLEERRAVIRIAGQDSPMPLLAMGDGMNRVLQITLAALRARNGFLLIDELENGLHYSVQEKVWQLLFGIAKKNNVQIFVATHSSDCVRAFAKVALEDSEQQGVLIRFSRDEDEWCTLAAAVGQKELASLVAANIEVR